MYNTQKIAATDVIEVEAGLRAILRNEYPEVSAERGSTLGDIIITSLSYLAAAIKVDARAISENMYLADLQSSDSAESFLALQDLASNFLVSTVDTPPKRGRVTFRFTTNISRVIPADITLSRGGNSINIKLFNTSQDITISQEEYLVVEDSGVTFYDYTILMESVRVADDVSILPGPFESSSNLIDLDSIFNRSSFVGQTETEYAQKSLVDRMMHSLQSFNFTSQRGIQATVLNEGIPNLIRVLGIGAGDSEMRRDVIPASLSSSRFHALGMINVVLSSTVTFESMPLSADTQTIGGKPVLGVLDVTRGGSSLSIASDFGTTRYLKSFDPSTGTTSVTYTEISQGQVLDPGSITIQVPEQEDILANGSSALNKFVISVAEGESTVESAELAIDNNIPTVQGLIDSDEYNSLGSSIQASGSFMVQVIIPSLQITLARGIDSTSVNLSRIKTTITEFINTWDQEYPLSLGDLQVRLGLVYSGLITSFAFEGGCTYIVYLPDGRILPFSSSGSLGIENDSYQLSANSVSYSDTLASLQMSNRLLNYLCTPEDINIGVANV